MIRPSTSLQQAIVRTGEFYEGLDQDDSVPEKVRKKTTRVILQEGGSAFRKKEKRSVETECQCGNLAIYFQDSKVPLQRVPFIRNVSF